MEKQVKTELQALRQALLAAADPKAAGQINALVTLGFRKLQQGDFTAAYVTYSFWPQLAVFLPEAVQPALHAQLVQLEQGEV